MMDPVVRAIFSVFVVFLVVLSGEAIARDALYFYKGGNNSYALDRWRLENGFQSKWIVTVE